MASNAENIFIVDVIIFTIHLRQEVPEISVHKTVLKNTRLKYTYKITSHISDGVSEKMWRHLIGSGRDLPGNTHLILT